MPVPAYSRQADKVIAYQSHSRVRKCHQMLLICCLKHYMRLVAHIMCFWTANGIPIDSWYALHSRSFELQQKCNATAGFQLLQLWIRAITAAYVSSSLTSSASYAKFLMQNTRGSECRWNADIHLAQISIVSVSGTSIEEMKYTLARVSPTSNMREQSGAAKSIQNVLILTLSSRIYRTGCQTSC